jgi:hypothetical protein
MADLEFKKIVTANPYHTCSKCGESTRMGYHFCQKELNPVEIEHKTTILGEMYDGMGDFVRRGAALAYIFGSFGALLEMKPENLRKEYLLAALKTAYDLAAEVMPELEARPITVVEGK